VSALDTVNWRIVIGVELVTLGLVCIFVYLWTRRP
jgi:hypothetical protein